MALIYVSRRILQCRKLMSGPRNIGYVVLLPEIGDATAQDKFAQRDNLPEFSNFTIENCTSLIAKQVLEFESGVKKIEKNIELGNCDFVENVLKPLEILSTPLELTWCISKTLYLGNNTSIPTKTYLPIHDRARRARSTKYNNIKIFKTVEKELSESKKINSEVKRILKKFFLEGKLNGLALETDKKREVLKEVLVKINKEKEILKKKVDYQTEMFTHTLTDFNIVRSFPNELLEVIATDSKSTLSGPWKITLQPNVYALAMQHCPDREVRWNLWQASVNRGSGYLDKDRSTENNIEEIRSQRHELAKLLGYDTFADMSMETKMAGSVQKVKSTINNMLKRAKPAQDRELEQLLKFAADNGFQYEKLELWDLPYWRKRQELLTYNYNPEKFKEYFPFQRVLKGLFGLSEKLFNIVIKQRKNVSTWHKGVTFYDIYEPHCSAPVAGFYLDPYAKRESRFHNVNSNGWVVGIQNKSQICDKVPLASLIFSFDLPSNGRDCHLSVKDVNNLFFRFGHALQHLLTRTTYSEVAGHSNIEWDMVEVSGHVFSHFLCNHDVIRSISCNPQSGESLPDNLLNSMLEIKKHMAGLDLSKELYLSALDLEFYSKTDYWLNIVKDLWPQFRSFPLDKLDAHPCHFTKIFSEEWAAAYYSHIWSRMIAADVYSAFEEVQGNEKELISVGKRYRDTFLALGGSVSSTKVFRRFRGRDPSPEALLSHLGLN